MRAMRVYSAPCAPVPPLRSPPSCLRASRHCLGGAWACCVCVCAHRARFARVPHCLGRLPPSPSVWGGGLSGILHKSRLFPPLCLGGGPGPAKLCVCVCARFARVPPRLARIPPLPPVVPSRRTLTRPYPPPPRSPPLPGGACLRMLEAHLCVCSSCPRGGGRSPIGARLPT